MKKFKVLFLYPNLTLANGLPLGIATLSACLKENGFEVECFDTTYYKTVKKTFDERRVETLQLKSFNLEESGVNLNESDLEKDLLSCLENYKPDLIAISFVELTFYTGLRMLEVVKQYKNIPVVAGGIYVTFSPDIVISKNVIDYICLGEGEEALVELAEALYRGEETSGIKNIWEKKRNADGSTQIIKNHLRPLIDIDILPTPDFSIFEERRILRPMQGKVYHMLPFETARGCPYRCTYCAAPSQIKFYKNEVGKKSYFRKKSIDRIFQEMDDLIKKFNCDYVYFSSETLLVMNKNEFNEFCDRYAKIALPFWFQTRVETIDDYSIKRLMEIGAQWTSCGIEQGNEEFRKSHLGKRMSNDAFMRGFDVLHRNGLGVTGNNIIGFPFETRELVFDTIELNRQIEPDTANAYIFAPFRGTDLYDVCVENNFIEDAEVISSEDCADTSVLEMPEPYLSQEDIKGLLKTFNLYLSMPKERFPDIEIAEKSDEEGVSKYNALKEEYHLGKQ